MFMCCYVLFEGKKRSYALSEARTSFFNAKKILPRKRDVQGFSQRFLVSIFRKKIKKSIFLFFLCSCVVMCCLRVKKDHTRCRKPEHRFLMLKKYCLENGMSKVFPKDFWCPFFEKKLKNRFFYFFYVHVLLCVV